MLVLLLSINNLSDVASINFIVLCIWELLIKENIEINVNQ